MEVIQLHHPYNQAIIPEIDTVLVLGFFDGVHRGHQAVIQCGKRIAQAKGLKLAVMTFNHRPSIVFKKTTYEDDKYLTSLSQRQRRMEKLGVDILYIVEFTSDFASLSPEKFVEQYIINLHAKAVVAGFDYSFGKPGMADMTRLKEIAKQRFEVVEVARKEADDLKISSSRISELLVQGDIDQVNQLLGYIYETDGVVVHGDARGRTLGYPTANVLIDSDEKLPKVGVYAVEIKVQGVWYRGMAQIGYDITFGEGRQLTVEVNILEFAREIYGEKVIIRWYTFFRDELKFASADGLIEQLHQDKMNTENYFLKRQTSAKQESERLK